MDNFSKESYDKIFATSKKYAKHYKAIRFYPVWDYVSDLVLHDNVYELGCGCGHLAHCLFDKGHTGAYEGCDFSEIAVEKAKQRVPSYSFVIADLRELKIASVATIIATEVFEHIEDDKDLIAKLPKDSRVVFSVPNYKCPNHYRVYKDAYEIIDYYKELLKISSIRAFKQNDKGDIIFVVDSIKI